MHEFLQDFLGQIVGNVQARLDPVRCRVHVAGEHEQGKILGASGGPVSKPERLNHKERGDKVRAH